MKKSFKRSLILFSKESFKNFAFSQKQFSKAFHGNSKNNRFKSLALLLKTGILVYIITSETL